MDVIFFQHGGLLRYVARTLLKTNLRPGLNPAECAPCPWAAAVFTLSPQPGRGKGGKRLISFFFFFFLSLWAGLVSTDLWNITFKTFTRAASKLLLTDVSALATAAFHLTWTSIQTQEENRISLSTDYFPQMSRWSLLCLVADVRRVFFSVYPVSEG